MIPILFTGGTIGMRHDSAAGGAVPTLSGRDILAATTGAELLGELAPEEWSANPGPHMTIERQWALRMRVRELLARPEVEGVVITHGTDTMEETGYLLARSLPPDRPVVLTGAMRSGSELGWDGPANLLDALRVASTPASRGRGAMIVMGGRIFSALDVVKTDTHMLDAFESPGAGPLGSVEDGRVFYQRTLAALPRPLDPPAPVGPVDIVTAHSGADARLLDASFEQARGVVIAALGRGNLPPLMADGIERWVRGGRPVVVASRAVRGRVGPTYGYPGGGRRLVEMGAMLAGSLRPQQARLELMLALGAGLSGTALSALLER